MVEQDFYWIFDVLCRLGRYLEEPNVKPVQQFHEILVCIPYHHIFQPLDTLVADGCEDDFIEGAVRIFDSLIFVEVFLLLVFDGGVAVREVEGVSW